MTRVQIGGEVDRVAAGFSLSGADLDPAAVTAALATAPSVAYRKGELRPPRGGRSGLRRATGLWQLQSTLRRDLPLDRHLRHLLDQLSPHGDYIRGLVAGGFDARFSCGLFLERWNRGTELSADTLQRIAELGAGFGLDIYCDGGTVDVVEDSQNESG